MLRKVITLDDSISVPTVYKVTGEMVSRYTERAHKVRSGQVNRANEDEKLVDEGRRSNA